MNKSLQRKASRILLAVMATILILTMIGCANGPFAGGNGSAESPYQIANAAQLDQVRNYLGDYFVLTADIDLSSYKNWEPIGVFKLVDEVNIDRKLAFHGSFDGQNHTISNLTINRNDLETVGLFGSVERGDASSPAVCNLTLTNINVTGGSTAPDAEETMTGGVIGYQSAGSVVKNVHLTGNNKISGSCMVGGIVGGGLADIVDCSANADITLRGDNTNGAGIIGGGQMNASIINCTASGTVTADGNNVSAVGGLAACAMNRSENVVENCHAKNVIITIKGENNHMIGGLLGHSGALDGHPATTISNCSTDNVTIQCPASTDRIGGLVGGGYYMEETKTFIPEPAVLSVEKCTTSGSMDGVSGDRRVGTIVGDSTNANVSNCTSSMLLNGTEANQTGKAQ